jgi:hypothetical protein
MNSPVFYPANDGKTYGMQDGAAVEVLPKRWSGDGTAWPLNIAWNGGDLQGVSIPQASGDAGPLMLPNSMDYIDFTSFAPALGYYAVWWFTFTAGPGGCTLSYPQSWLTMNQETPECEAGFTYDFWIESVGQQIRLSWREASAI